MANKIVIERLEFQGRCGVTSEERRYAQPLAADLELDCDTDPAAASDRIMDTVDYARVAERIADMAQTQECVLLETLGERLLTMLFAEFPIERAKLWLRKLTPPLLQLTGSVGVKMERGRAAYPVHRHDPLPSRFLVQNLNRLPKGRVLDVACGTGRHSIYLAGHGFEIDAIDRDTDALSKLAATAKQRNLPNVRVKSVDLERTTEDRPEFPPDRYDVIVVCFYLYRQLFPSLIDALKPNGVLLYETFMIDNYLHHRHPRRWEFCLAHNELLRLTSALRVLAYDEGEHDGGSGMGSVYSAHLLAQKPGAVHSSHESH